MSRQVSKSDNLQNKIDQLVQLQAEQMADLKDSATQLMSSLSPAQMLRSTLKEVTASPDLRGAAIDTALGIGAGFISRKLYVRKSHNLISKIAGPALQFFITSFVRNKLSKRRHNKEETPDN